MNSELTYDLGQYNSIRVIKPANIIKLGQFKHEILVQRLNYIKI